jgi:hypothetical protein
MDPNLPGRPDWNQGLFLTIPPLSMSVRRLFVAVGGHETTLSLILGDIEIDGVTILVGRHPRLLQRGRP